MPQPANSRIRDGSSASTPRRSAARCPTRRRRRRRSSRPARRSGRGPCARARRSRRPPTAVGVPHTAADGCSDAARVSDDASSASTPATSVARCMTFDRCSTNGASGTFIDEQCGASASATERTAYSCSSRSFDDRASDAASARSCVVVAGAPDGAGQHPRGDQALLAAGRAARAWRRPGRRRRTSSVVRYCSASRCSSQRTSSGAPVVTSRSRASTTLSSSPAVIRATASATTPGPLGGGQGAVGEGDVGAEPRAPRSGDDGGRRGHGRRRRCVVTQPRPPAPADHDDLGHDQRRRRRRVAGEGEGPERDRAGAGQVDLVAHDRVRHHVAPPALRPARTGRCPRLERAARAPADDALAAPDPGHDVGGRPRAAAPAAAPGRRSPTVRTTTVSGQSRRPGPGRDRATRHGQRAYARRRAPPGSSRGRMTRARRRRHRWRMRP